MDVAYGIGNAALDRMTADMAIELATERITMVSLWPGFVQTEKLGIFIPDTYNCTMLQY